MVKIILKYIWVLWLNAWLVAYGITFDTWQWWVFTLILALLMGARDIVIREEGLL